MELLVTLKRQGFEMVVISARKNLFLLEQQLSYLGLLEYFSRVLVVRDQSDGSEKGGSCRSYALTCMWVIRRCMPKPQKSPMSIFAVSLQDKEMPVL
ncbi:hypothetical protein [Leptospirillum ferrooxidans]|uniref:hypothetical protein n=1 Tax=Leptospirillum ferrooxidans TaxID=180 RepID=UPI0002F2F20B|nr:hypothetical protein [Leptospirillum ferrooxidans]